MADKYEERMAPCYAALEKSGNRIELVDEPCRTAIIVETAMAIVVNGGFPYFFEVNFVNDPEYGIFTDALRRVGLVEIADRFAALVARFPFDTPHTSHERRNAFLEICPDDFETAMTELESLIYATDIDAAIMRFLSNQGLAALPSSG